MKVEQRHGPKVKPFEVSELEYLLQADSPDLFFSFGFQKSGQVVVACAPARLDIMGGIADYCGANVFEMPLNRTALAACQAREDQNISAITLNAEGGLRPNFHLSLDNFYTDDAPKMYPEMQEFFNKEPKTAWAGYILGAFHVLLKEGKISQFPHGATIVINSSIPMGGGLASSAAIEVATLMALNHLYNLELGMMEIARLAQTVENQIVGAPCGIMDQVVSVAGRSTKILSILCQPGEILEFVSCPPNVSFVGIHTKVRRSTTSTAYIDTRIGSFMGLAILQAAFASDTDTRHAPIPEDRDRHGKLSEKLADNYLCNLSVAEFHEHCEPLLPEKIHGAAFLEKYGETVDAVTRVVPEKLYVVKDRVEHAVYENARVKQFIKAIKNADNDPEHTPNYLGEAGYLMYESNASYRDLAGLGCPEVDGLVNIAQKIGKQGGIYGAKITGGGGGGTVALLCHGNVESSLTQILAAYKLAWGIDAELIRGNAEGTFEFGHILWELKELEPPTHF